MRRQALRRGLWSAAAVLWMLVIWSNSLRTAAESLAQSSEVMELLMPQLETMPMQEELWHAFVRKLAHMGEFALLGMLWNAALLPSDCKRPRRTVWNRRGWALFFCLLAALADETIQLFVPGRSGQLQDVGIDMLGSVLGSLLFFAARWAKSLAVRTIGETEFVRRNLR